MALVAYEANSDSDVSEDEEDEVEKTKIELIEPRMKPSKFFEKDGCEISDDEDDFYDPQSSGIFEEEPDLISLISQKLPNAKIKTAQQSFVDETEVVLAFDKGSLKT